MSVVPDSSSVEQSRLQIRTILADVAQLSKQDVSPDEFHPEFLNLVVSGLAAVGGVLWTLENGTLSLAYQINFKAVQFQNENDQKKHHRLLYRMLHSSESGTLFPPDSSGDFGNPTNYTLLFCPIRTELEAVGIVEIIQRHDADTATQKSFLQFLAQVCHLATDYYKNRQLRHFGERQNLWTQLEDFCRSVHQSLNVKSTAYTLVNEGRRLIECDRVSIALRDGKTCPIVAVSGQDTVDRRSTVIRLLGKLAAAVVKAGEPIWYTGDTANLPPQIEKTVEKYADESHSKTIAVFPLFRNKKKHEDDLPQTRKPQELPFGALLIEQIEDSRVTERMKKRVGIVAEYASSALGNALEYHSIFLLPVWKTLGKIKKLFAADFLPKTITVTIIIAACLAALWFLPWKFQMHCTGTLEPIRRHRIYSPLDAEVKRLYVDHNDRVEGPSTGADGVQYRGTTLLELRSSELDALNAQLHGEQQEIEEKIVSLTRMMQGQLSDYDRADLVGQMEQAKIKQETVKKKLAIFEQQQKPELFVTSPMDGVVVSWDIKRRLTEKRPISRMQYVMEIADLEGPWQLELLMPEKRMGYIAEQLKGHSKEAGIISSTMTALRVEFVLATNPSVKYFGTVTEIHDRAEVRSDSGSAAAMSSSLNTVLIKVALDDQETLPSALRPGAECSAKIYCGKKPLGYVLFYEVIDFVQKNILFRWF